MPFWRACLILVGVIPPSSDTSKIPHVWWAGGKTVKLHYCKKERWGKIALSLSLCLHSALTLSPQKYVQGGGMTEKVLCLWRSTVILFCCCNPLLMNVAKLRGCSVVLKPVDANRSCYTTHRVTKLQPPPLPP